MVNYPNGKKGTQVNKSISYSRRGMTLEEDLNITNSYYLETDRAVIYKKPTPITIVNVDYKKRSSAKITEAYFQLPSTTDYNGIYRGYYLDFEAKQTKSKTSFSLNLIHPHQLKHLERVIRHGGIGFLVVRFTSLDETYVVMAQEFLDESCSTTAKSIKLEWFRSHGHLIPLNYSIRVDYLKVIDEIIDGGNADER